MKVSNCCGADGKMRLHSVDNWLDESYADLGICPKCGEHCEYIDETDLNTINTENETNRSKEGTPVQVEGSINK